MDVADFLEPLRRLHSCIRDGVLLACERSSTEELSRIDRESEGDTIFAVDRVGEDLLVDFIETEVARSTPIVLIAEGLPLGQIVLPRGTSEGDARWRVIIDPIDGTRQIMYQKRSAWILTGVAPNRGMETNLGDIELALQTEIPPLKQHLCDSVWWIDGAGVQGERLNRLTADTSALNLKPSRADSILQGFATVSRFFPGARDELAAIDEEIVEAALGPVQRGKTLCFEDQYSCTGGQLYELMAGRDRFIADLRPLMEKRLADGGRSLGICCHPYDVCTERIARELGVVVTDEKGQPLRNPLNVDAEITWVGYANERIRAQIEPLLQASLSKRGLL